MTPAPILVLGWGNPSRGDDGLGPLFVAELADRVSAAVGAQVEWLEDYQLQIEHALDLRGRRQVLLVDASLDGASPFSLQQPQARRDASFTSHALSPAALLQVLADLDPGSALPPCTLLAVRGERFGLGEALSATGRTHLDAALAWAEGWLAAQVAALASTSTTMPACVPALLPH